MPTAEPKIFLPPRPKRTLLSSGPPSKKRKTVHKIEEISFDNDARADYLTGFHKRKVARATRAKEEAEKREKEEKVRIRAQVSTFILFIYFTWDWEIEGRENLAEAFLKIWANELAV